MKKYPKYKDSGIEWIGEIPEHWDVWKLSHAFTEIGSGTTPTSGESKYHENGTINWLNTGDLNDGYLSSSKKKVTELAVKDYSALKVFPTNSLVIAMYGATIGKVSLLNFETTVNQACCVLANSDIVNKRFLFYWFLANKQEIINLAKGGGQPNISQDIIKGLKIPVSNDEFEQEYIANYLDRKTAEIDSLIEKKEQLIELYKEERTATINQFVTKGLDPNVLMKDSGIEWLGEIPKHWEVKKFKHEFDFGRGLGITKENLQDKGIPCLNYGEIHSKFGFEVDTRIHNLKCVDEKYLETSEKSLLNQGDFIFSDTSEDIEGAGNFTYLKSDEPIFAGYHTVIAKPKKNRVESRFFAYLFDSLRFRTQIRSEVKGIKVFSITQAILKNSAVLKPPYDEQVEISKYLTDLDNHISAEISKTKQEIELLKEYKRALITEVVLGKVDVREDILGD